MGRMKNLEYRFILNRFELISQILRKVIFLSDIFMYMIRYTKFWSTLLQKISLIFFDDDKTLSSFVAKFCFENILTFFIPVGKMPLASFASFAIFYVFVIPAQKDVQRMHYFFYKMSNQTKNQHCLISFKYTFQINVTWNFIRFIYSDVYNRDSCDNSCV